MRLLLPVTAVACLIVMPAHAQGLSGLTSQGSEAQLVLERAEVEERSLHSFRTRADARIAELSGDAATASRDDIRRVSERVRADYSRALSALLDELESDGILTAAEVADDVGPLYERHFSYLDSAVGAVQDGSRPPPFRGDFDGLAAYAEAMARYTLLERNSWQGWLLLVGCLAGAVLLARLLTGLGRRLGRALRERSYEGFATVLESLDGPLYLAIIALGLDTALNGIWVPAAMQDVLHGAVQVALVGAFFWLLWNASVGASTAMTNMLRSNYEHDFSANTRSILVRVLRIVVLTGLLFVLLRYVLDTDLRNLLAGLGLLGIALYFMLRGTLQNIAASFTIYGDQPFRVGDLVIWQEQWGTIEDIGFRSTRLRTLDGHLLTIPNSEVIETSVQNVEARPFIRRRFRIALRFETPPDRIREAISIVSDILDDHRGQPDGYPPHVVFETIGDYQQVLLVQYYYEPPDYWEALAFDTEVNLAILERFEAAGIGMAFPTETHQVELDEAFEERLAEQGERSED